MGEEDAGMCKGPEAGMCLECLRIRQKPGCLDKGEW